MLGDVVIIGVPRWFVENMNLFNTAAPASTGQLPACQRARIRAIENFTKMVAA